MSSVLNRAHFFYVTIIGAYNKRRGKKYRNAYLQSNKSIIIKSSWNCLHRVTYYDIRFKFGIDICRFVY